MQLHYKMLSQEKFARDLQDTDLNLLYDIVHGIKQDNNGKVYKTLDDFSTWCKFQNINGKKIRGRTTRSYVNGVKQLFIFLDIDIDNGKFRHKVSLPKVTALRDEYPDNTDIKKIMAAATKNMRLIIQTLCDYGFEPTDIAQLKPKHLHFDESPVRGNMDREKTGEPLEFFLNDDTAEALKQKIETEKIEPDSYIFVDKFSKYTVNNIRVMYNTTLARAGFGKLVKTKTGWYATVDKIHGHTYGKYHMKVFKKHWFSLAIASGVPEYIVQGMLGRKQYLDEYNRQPLHVRQQFAKKLLRVVSIYRDEKSQEEALEAGQILGLGKLTPEQAKALKETLSFFMKMGPNKRKEMFKIDHQESES